MDFGFFESLTFDQAQVVLDEYLVDGRIGLDRVQSDASSPADGWQLSLQGTTRFFQWVTPRLVTVRREPDVSLPQWIRDTPVYERGLFDFDTDSASLVLVWSYHLGQTFVHLYPDRLRWATGAPGTAEVHQPVVVGFEHGMELSTLLVAENLFRRTLKEPEPTDFVTPAVEKWASFMN